MSDNLPFMQGLPSESMKLIVTSPPYNLGKEYEQRRSKDEYLAQQKVIIKEAVRCRKNDQCSPSAQVGQNGVIEQERDLSSS
jgi:DNA modification methylase